MDWQIREMGNGTFEIQLGETLAIVCEDDFRTLIEEASEILRAKRLRESNAQTTRKAPERTSSYVVAMADWAFACGVCPVCSGAMRRVSYREGARLECPTHG